MNNFFIKEENENKYHNIFLDDEYKNINNIFCKKISFKNFNNAEIKTIFENKLNNDANANKTNTNNDYSFMLCTSLFDSDCSIDLYSSKFLSKYLINYCDLLIVTKFLFRKKNISFRLYCDAITYEFYKSNDVIINFHIKLFDKNRINKLLLNIIDDDDINNKNIIFNNVLTNIEWFDAILKKNCTNSTQYMFVFLYYIANLNFEDTTKLSTNNFDLFLYDFNIESIKKHYIEKHEHTENFYTHRKNGFIGQLIRIIVTRDTDLPTKTIIMIRDAHTTIPNKGDMCLLNKFIKSDKKYLVGYNTTYNLPRHFQGDNFRHSKGILMGYLNFKTNDDKSMIFCDETWKRTYGLLFSFCQNKNNEQITKYEKHIEDITLNKNNIKDMINMMNFDEKDTEINSSNVLNIDEFKKIIKEQFITYDSYKELQIYYLNNPNYKFTIRPWDVINNILKNMALTYNRNIFNETNNKDNFTKFTCFFNSLFSLCVIKFFHKKETDIDKFIVNVFLNNNFSYKKDFNLIFGNKNDNEDNDDINFNLFNKFNELNIKNDNIKYFIFFIMKIKEIMQNNDKQIFLNKNNICIYDILFKHDQINNNEKMVEHYKIKNNEYIELFSYYYYFNNINELNDGDVHILYDIADKNKFNHYLISLFYNMKMKNNTDNHFFHECIQKLFINLCLLLHNVFMDDETFKQLEDCIQKINLNNNNPISFDIICNILEIICSKKNTTNPSTNIIQNIYFLIDYVVNLNNDQKENMVIKLKPFLFKFQLKKIIHIYKPLCFIPPVYLDYGIDEYLFGKIFMYDNGKMFYENDLPHIVYIEGHNIYWNHILGNFNESHCNNNFDTGIMLEEIYENVFIALKMFEEDVTLNININFEKMENNVYTKNEYGNQYEISLKSFIIYVNKCRNILLNALYVSELKNIVKENNILKYLFFSICAFPLVHNHISTLSTSTSKPKIYIFSHIIDEKKKIINSNNDNLLNYILCKKYYNEFDNYISINENASIRKYIDNYNLKCDSTNISLPYMFDLFNDKNFMGNINNQYMSSYDKLSNCVSINEFFDFFYNHVKNNLISNV
jgi:hypothetical protein